MAAPKVMAISAICWGSMFLASLPVPRAARVYRSWRLGADG
jgi:hypothetical protein